MTEIRSLKQLDAVLLQLLADCMNEVVVKAEKRLKEHVDTDVYAAGTAKGRTHYYDGSAEPTGEFKESITHSNTEISGDEVTAKVFHDKNKMRYDADTFLHGSSYFTPNDVREILPYLIDQGKTGPMFGPKWQDLTRPYMTNTREELNEGLLKQWMIEALSKRGIKVAGKWSIGAY